MSEKNREDELVKLIEDVCGEAYVHVHTKGIHQACYPSSPWGGVSITLAGGFDIADLKKIVGYMEELEKL